ncbi:hypothetical protein NUW58_g2188 [Xylaria curta]|uniref:Uncharacterized protein n=1 Tax=Xylaria curta TaxID=42375 RepID=A0ACC1PGT0_9PEZI|nr:hypothetical protein NUW58_g2188 [Xylaria curta]
MENTGTKLTFRLRRCPADANVKACAALLGLAFDDLDPEDIHIRSLAFSLDPWERPPTKTATLMFRKIPALLLKKASRCEWELAVESLEEPLILDTHFLGLTPLNDIESESHAFDCIAVSGLASHPFGSWQPKGEDKSFMWIREALPRALPMMRTILYGYDTALINSNSFQTTGDLASTFVNHITANGWDLAGSKRLVFLAHSLGGIVLKEAFRLMANGNSQEQNILDRFVGGIFFGVPSHGMETSHLLTMVRGQVNEEFIEALSSNSKYLRLLDDHFAGLISTREMHFCWAFETKTSPTVMRHEDGRYSRDGPEEILVTKESATRNLYHLRASDTFQIDENHSDMIKFRRGDPNLHIVENKLRGICEQDRAQRRSGKQRLHESNSSPGFESLNNPSLNRSSAADGHPSSDLMAVLKSLKIPGRDNRLDTIDERFRHTLEWIFDPEPMLVKWLREGGTGMFWIHGKPGSGKSTLMKFIFQSQQTWELLHRFSSDAHQIKCAFFFHDRGTLLQRSFEGFLRSVLHQILEASQALTHHLLDHLSSKFPGERFNTAQYWSIPKLESCLLFIFRQTQTRLDLFFVCDALDEYDGKPEFVCSILKDFIRAAANSPNRLKLLFSSRSWDIFKQNFGTVRSLQLQDYTRNDIRRYCLDFIESQGEDISRALDSLVLVVVERANGVFLWVKLVLRELISEAAKGKSPDELLLILSGIPDDLRDYYVRTIERTPEKFRMEAYVIFQALAIDSRFSQSWDVVRLMRLIASFQASTYYTVRKKTKYPLRYSPFANWEIFSRVEQSSHRQKLGEVLSKVERSVAYKRGFMTPADIKQQISLITTVTGGLIEFINVKEGRNGTVCEAQLAHQTVLEFVNGHDFKKCILGHQARMTFENGYTFCARYSIARKSSDGPDWLFANEHTTGRSLQKFMDTVPDRVFQEIPGMWTLQVVTVTGPLGFALANGLQLYLRDALEQRPGIFRETTEKLLSVLPRLTSNPRLPEIHLSLIRHVLDNGYTVEQDPQALHYLLQVIIELRIGCMDSWNKTMVRCLEAQAAILIHSGLSASEHGKFSRYRHKICNRYYQSFAHNSVQVIHIAGSDELIKVLIDAGCDINTPDLKGNRPLDHALGYWNYNIGACLVARPTGLDVSNEEDRTNILQRINLLIKLGGTTSTSPKSVWESCIEDLTSRGLDAGEILACFRRLSIDTETTWPVLDAQALVPPNPRMWNRIAFQ